MVGILIGCADRNADSRAVDRRTGAAGGDPAISRMPMPRIEMTEMATSLGLLFRHEAGDETKFSMPAIMGGGGAIFDADGDARPDIYLVQSGESSSGQSGNQLFLQQSDGSFTAAPAGFGGDDRGYGMGAAVGDWDNDGDLDLYVSNLGPDVALENDGHGRFTDVTRSLGLGDRGWGTSATFCDYDRDGDLDLYVARYVDFDPDRRCVQRGGQADFCGPTAFPGIDDRLYRNDGRRFVDVSDAAGILGVEDAGLGVVCRDLDGDGWNDFYVANDADPNNLWINQRDGTFVDEGVLRGVAFNLFGAGEAGMGIASGDADEDGDLDLFVTHLIEETNTFYRSLGDGTFEDATATSELGPPSLDLTGFGTGFVDLDNDGDLDLGVANGATKVRPESVAGREGWFWDLYAEPDLILLNDGRGRFVRGSGGEDFDRAIGVSRGFVAFDLEGDGDQDLLLTDLESEVRLYRNESAPGPAWVLLDLWDTALGRFAVGASVWVKVEGVARVRHSGPGDGYLTSSSLPVHFGLGDAESIDSVVVRWEDGTEEHFEEVAIRQRSTLRRGEGRAP